MQDRWSLKHDGQWASFSSDDTCMAEQVNVFVNPSMERGQLVSQLRRLADIIADSRPVRLAIKHNTRGKNVPCALCGEHMQAELGPAIVLDNNGWDFVCDECAALQDAWMYRVKTIASNVERGADPHEFGVCPECGGSNGYVNIHREHWFFCKQHKTKWLRGENLFSGWRNENEDLWKQNADMLAEYKEVPSTGAWKGRLAGCLGL